MTTLMDTVRTEAPRRSPVQVGGPFGCRAGHSIRVTISRALVRG